MDHRQFDAVIRAWNLRRGATRRQGIAALIMALGGAASANLAHGGSPDRQGPCKSFERPDNICTRDSDCCTDVCDLEAGLTNRDGLGRCRCKQANESCTADHNCCQRGARPQVCVHGVCGRASKPRPRPTSTPTPAPTSTPTSTPTPTPTSTPTPSCDSVNCPLGCCSGTTCVLYANQNNTSCGSGGIACQPCIGGAICSTGNGQCLN